jgi:hypothetical protein
MLTQTLKEEGDSEKRQKSHRFIQGVETTFSFKLGGGDGRGRKREDWSHLQTLHAKIFICKFIRNRGKIVWPLSQCREELNTSKFEQNKLSCLRRNLNKIFSLLRIK